MNTQEEKVAQEASNAQEDMSNNQVDEKLVIKRKYTKQVKNDASSTDVVEQNLIEQEDKNEVKVQTKVETVGNAQKARVYVNHNLNHRGNSSSNSQNNNQGNSQNNSHSNYGRNNHYQNGQYNRSANNNNYSSNYGNNTSNSNNVGGNYQRYNNDTNRKYNYNNSSHNQVDNLAVQSSMDAFKYDKEQSADGLIWGGLVALGLTELMQRYPELEINKSDNLKKSDVLSALVQEEMASGRSVYVDGLFDIMPDGYGFIRFSEFCYLSSGEDIYVSHQLIRQFQLKVGDRVFGTVRLPRQGDKYFGLESVLQLNKKPPLLKGTRVSFEKLTPLYPNRRINLTPTNQKDSLVLRMMDIVSPLGFGQRALIVAPPKTGKTEMMQAVAHAIADNHPEVVLFVLLIDERPEEVTDMIRSVKGEVISSTFDEQALRHVQVAEMLIERAKRLVEEGKDVVILMDAITRLGRAYNTTCPSSGKVLSGGVEANALHKPKRFFGAARNIEEGGSLTIIATALIETNSKMDEVIFEEFKGTGNSEIQLSRALAERGAFPAININSSSTRRDELLLTEEEFNKRRLLRRVLHSMSTVESTELLIDKLKSTKTNAEFFASLSKV